MNAENQKVRGKKNLVIQKSLAGPIGIFVKFSTLQEYGIDKIFFLENDNVDASQKNIIFLASGEKATRPIAIAGAYGRLVSCPFVLNLASFISSQKSRIVILGS